MITELQQNVFKRYHSDKHLSEFYTIPTRWRQKSTSIIDMEQNYVTVALCTELILHGYNDTIR